MRGGKPSGIKPLETHKNRCYPKIPTVAQRHPRYTPPRRKLGEDKNTRDREEPRSPGQRSPSAPYSCHRYTDRDSNARW